MIFHRVINIFFSRAVVVAQAVKIASSMLHIYKTKGQLYTVKNPM